MRSSRPLLIVLGVLLALGGLGLVGGAGGILWAHTTQRDADGFFTSPDYELGTDGYAVTSDELRLATHPGDWVPGPGDLTFRVAVTSRGSATPVFVGIAPTADVTAFLADVAHDQVVLLGPAGDDVVMTRFDGEAAPGAPRAADLWTVVAEGSGTQELTVDAAVGDWTVVVMNADGSAGVDVVATAGVRSALLLPVALGLLVVGGLLLLAALALLVAGAASATTGAAVAPEGRGVHPVTITGALDPDLSRGLWLVKWLLALPHVVVLAFLWVAFLLLTVVAGVVILFTGRYPPAIFDFNVGVLRWTWRVTYYAYGVLGTDRYPPFTLAPDPTYPATLDVARPGELSRGLVLVKWWLLAIPHYVIVGVFTGSLVTWTVDTGATGGWQTVVGGGLVGVLVVVAGITLLVRGRYPTALHDLVMGLQRWVYRVTAYAALLTDEYPPFRLDLGGDEPPAPPSGSPGGPSAEPDQRRTLTPA